MPHRHAVGAYEGEPLLGLEPRRLQASRRERLRAGHAASFVIGLAAPDEDLPDLRHLGQVGLSHGTPSRTTGCTPAFNASTNACTSSVRTPTPPFAIPLARVTIIARTTSGGISAP